MKKLLFAAVTLDIGGIETALVTLLNYLAKEKENNNFKYEITLVLEKKQGLFLDAIDKKVKIMEYAPSKLKFSLLRKTINFIKQNLFKIKYKNKFDFSVAYATYSMPASFIARTVSTNSCLWCHMDYLEQYDGNVEKVKKFFEEKKFRKFKNIVFVSEQGKESFNSIYSKDGVNVLQIDNLINYEDIINKASKIDNEYKEILKKVKINESTVFLNVGRHEENQKKISRIIEAAKKLNDNNFNTVILFVGDGIDNEKYKNMVKEYKLTDKIYFLGRKENPYPYFKIADALLLTSDFEGSPVVYTEAMILDLPIITTKVSGSEKVEGKYGLVVEKNVEDIYENMKKIIKNKYVIKEKFDPKKYNENIVKKLEQIM